MELGIKERKRSIVSLTFHSGAGKQGFLLRWLLPFNVMCELVYQTHLTSVMLNGFQRYYGMLKIPRCLHTHFFK